MHLVAFAVRAGVRTVTRPGEPVRRERRGTRPFGHCAPGRRHRLVAHSHHQAIEAHPPLERGRRHRGQRTGVAVQQRTAGARERIEAPVERRSGIGGRKVARERNVSAGPHGQQRQGRVGDALLQDHLAPDRWHLAEPPLGRVAVGRQSHEDAHRRRTRQDRRPHRSRCRVNSPQDALEGGRGH